MEFVVTTSVVFAAQPATKVATTKLCHVTMMLKRELLIVECYVPLAIGIRVGATETGLRRALGLGLRRAFGARASGEPRPNSAQSNAQPSRLGPQA